MGHMHVIKNVRIMNSKKKSFSGPKKVPLCKVFTICAIDGHVIDMLGPYPANLNDAEILKILLQDPNGLCY